MAIAVASGLAVCYGFFLWAAIAQKEARARDKIACMHHLTHLSVALQMYLADNDDVFPQGDSWCDGLLAYSGDKQAFHCPGASNPESAYAFSSALGGIAATSLQDPRRAVAIFESDGGWNAAGAAELLPIAPRHFGGDDYVFADGHISWLHRGTMSRIQWGPALKEEKPGSRQAALDAREHARRTP